ncbi:MAG TPA: thymidine kinase [Bacillota bacterium]|nr:thymidine kinase [Bacillota bacterium]
MAKLYFRYAAMNAGKTTQLLQVKYNYEERGQNVLLLKPAIDSRDSDAKILSRIGLECPATQIDPTTDIFNLVEQGVETRRIHCVIIDEAQFLSKDQVYQLCRVVDDLNIPVIAYGLRADFRGNLFSGSEALLAFADSIEELKTICWCGKKAIMNTRLANGKAVYEGAQIQIGGNESYISLCRKHWKEGKIGPDNDK